MKQNAFEQEYQQTWTEFERFLTFRVSRYKRFRKNEVPDEERPFSPSEFPDRYKALCHNLALARARGYSDQLIGRLNQLVVSGHHRLYGARANAKKHWVSSLLFGFPIALRQNLGFVALAALAFFGPFFIMALACYLNGEMIYSLMGVGTVSGVESMYEPGRHVVGRERDSATDVMMFGFYIKNNIGISFQSFAGGVLFGIGSLFVMIYNGLYIGGITGHLTQLGYGVTFYPFVSGHSAFELMAIVFSGAAGFKIGYAIISPGHLSRKMALRRAGRDAAWIVYGTTIMLVFAAFIEAFWSSKTGIDHTIKYSVGIALWIFVLYYCFFAGSEKNAT
ncbi:MAG: stage II sporulation protein M [Acidiferrobacterales bacterium]|nr:stage II sporulation protein M [Acidiferrobacterales bacterium]